MNDLIIMAGIALGGLLVGGGTVGIIQQSRLDRWRRIAGQEKFARRIYGNRLSRIRALEPGPRGNGTARKMAKIARGEQ